MLCCSVAILQYLVKKFSTPDHWYPADLQKGALADEFLSWQHTNLRTHASKIFWLRVRPQFQIYVELAEVSAAQTHCSTLSRALTLLLICFFTMLDNVLRLYLFNYFNFNKGLITPTSHADACSLSSPYTLSTEAHF